MTDTTFLLYTVLLAVSGIIQLVIAGVGFGQGVAPRVLAGLFGAAFLGYAIYLFFFFPGGDVRVFFYAFIIPVAMIVQAVKAARAKREQAVPAV